MRVLQETDSTFLSQILMPTDEGEKSLEKKYKNLNDLDFQLELCRAHALMQSGGDPVMNQSPVDFGDSLVESPIKKSLNHEFSWVKSSPALKEPIQFDEKHENSVLPPIKYFHFSKEPIDFRQKLTKKMNQDNKITAHLLDSSKLGVDLPFSNEILSNFQEIQTDTQEDKNKNLNQFLFSLKSPKVDLSLKESLPIQVISLSAEIEKPKDISIIQPPRVSQGISCLPVGLHSEVIRPVYSEMPGLDYLSTIDALSPLVEQIPQSPPQLPSQSSKEGEVISRHFDLKEKVEKDTLSFDQKKSEKLRPLSIGDETLPKLVQSNLEYPVFNFFNEHPVQSSSFLKEEVKAQIVPGSMAKERFSTDSLMNIAMGVRNLSMNGGGSLRVRIKPENLGEINIQVIVNEGKVGLKIQASHEKSKAILQENLNQLKESLQAQKLTLSHVDFTLSPSSNLALPSELHRQFDSFAQLAVDSGFQDFSGQSSHQNPHRQHVPASEIFEPQADSSSRRLGFKTSFPGMSSSLSKNNLHGRIDVRI